jgi:tetratricopeptide (TPR) repeat protein
LFIFVFKNGLISRRIPGDIDFYNARIYLWKDAVGIFLKYPVTGPGIAMFPAALEEFYSNALRFRDANVTYDHAHNNYLHTLFTMGLAGLIAYLILIYNSFVCAIKLMKNSDTKLVSSAVILMLAGYCVYGLTNFDDISILFLFFIFLSILRSLTLKKSEIRFKGFGTITAVFSAAIIFLLLFNIPYTVNKLRADRFYKETFANYQKGNFKAAVNINNEAINLNPDCPAYRYLEASEVLNYCIDNQSLNENAKADLLKQVEAEIEKIKKDLYYVNYCNGILSLVYFEEGRNQEAENLMKGVLNKDSININYRINLARYLLKVNRLEDVKRNLDIIILMRPYDPITALLNAMYYSKMNNREKAVYYSNEVLKSEPQNRIALDILNQMK